jgi:hypothetical protein
MEDGAHCTYYQHVRRYKILIFTRAERAGAHIQVDVCRRVEPPPLSTAHVCERVVQFTISANHYYEERERERELSCVFVLRKGELSGCEGWRWWWFDEPGRAFLLLLFVACKRGSKCAKSTFSLARSKNCKHSHRHMLLIMLGLPCKCT